MNKFISCQLVFCFVLTLGTGINTRSQDYKASDTSFSLLHGESWWGGPVNKGDKMPIGNQSFSFDLYGNNDGNQSVPLLLSNKGRYIWSDYPFRFSFRNDSIIIDNTIGIVKVGQKGSTLKEAYLDASRQFFPPSGIWPDSLLVTAPQYNLWIELMYNPNQKDVLDYARQVLSNGLPAGVLMIDDNWSNYYGHFNFNKEKFSDPKSLIDQLHGMGFKVMLWICPFISSDSEPFRELSSRKLLLLDNEGIKNANWQDISKPLLIQWWNGYSTCLDLTNPEAGKWLQDKLDFLQKEYGVDGFKLDAGDMEYYASSNLVSYKSVTPNDHCGLWGKIGLHYSLNEYRAAWKMGGQPLVQRLRDKEHTWDDLNKLIPNTIAQQLSGYTFTCPDMIGGGEYTTFLPGHTIDQKLVVRSAQCSALMPMMQFSAAPWRVLDSAHLSATKRAVEIRLQHLPYIMQVLRQSARSGEPVLRPMEYDFPNQGYENIHDQFMLGEKLMVAPVVSSSDNRQVQFPLGKWKYDNNIITGPVIKSYTVPLEELLIFERVR